MADKASETLPRYRLLTGYDDSAFCQRVSEMLDSRYKLYGSPSLIYDWDKKWIIASQAVAIKNS